MDVYTAPEFDKVSLYCYHNLKEYAEDAWEEEVWPFYLENGDAVTFNYNDSEEEYQTKEITIDEVSDDIPWYLDYQWANDECILLLPEKQYEELRGKDVEQMNISGLAGHEVFFVQSKAGKRTELEKCLKQMDLDTIGNPGYLVKRQTGEE